MAKRYSTRGFAKRLKALFDRRVEMRLEKGLEKAPKKSVAIRVGSGLLTGALVLATSGCDIYSMPRLDGTAPPPAAMSSQSATASNSYGAQAPGQADPRLTGNDSAQFFSKSGWQACGGGALVGVLGCQLGNPSDKKNCMLKAALAGCGVAMGVNYYLDQRRSEYSNEEQRLNIMLNDVREDNRKLQSLTQTARSVMAEDRQQIEQIKRDIAAKKVDRSQAQKQIAEIDANTQYLKKSLADLKSREKQWREVAAAERASGARVDVLDVEINRLNQQVASLETEINELYKQRSAIQLG